MPFASALSIEADSGKAVDECAGGVNWDGSVDLALIFFTPQHRKKAGRIAAKVIERFAPRCLLGCPGETVVGTGREVEEGPALCLWLGRWRERVELTAFHLGLEETSEGHSLLGWPDELAEADADESLVIALADPFTFPVDDFLRQMNESSPGLGVVGGMASGARQPGMSPLLIGSEAMPQGAVAALLRGPIGVRSVVSQGCRPIGKPFVVTKAQENVILELGGKPAIEQLQKLWENLTPRDQNLVRQGLHVGRALSEYQDVYQRGDFLIRNVICLDRDAGTLAITERVRPGQTVQFHVRDAGTADEDLREILQLDGSRHPGKVGGALLFSCNGRGSRLFDRPDHDAKAIEAAQGAIPLAGFFAQGELGPIGGQNFIHGFTASVVLFEE
ncbi:MAG: FIST C-terminal domain-containing protein [Planctomycetes bacterium]|nr:FIST C-terminal domain-containing protein [Planctomycetota bacterium]